MPGLRALLNDDTSSDGSVAVSLTAIEVIDVDVKLLTFTLPVPGSVLVFVPFCLH